MIVIAFSTVHQPWPYFRQTPGGKGVVGEVQFTLDAAAACGADYLVVYDEPDGTLVTDVPKNRRILFVTEPPGIRSYHSSYLRQFGTVVTPYLLRGFGFRQVIRHTALPWHFGIDFNASEPCATALDWDTLSSMPWPEKSRPISVITSTKAILPRHRERLAFIERLRREFGDAIDIFGRGFREIGDKADAILPYRFHIVLENNSIDHFWTEKLADAYLGFSMPLAVGSSNLGRYFPQGSFLELDINDMDEAVRKMRAAIDSNIDIGARAEILEGRRRVLEEHNLFFAIPALIRELGLSSSRRPAARRRVLLRQSHDCGIGRPIRRIKDVAVRTGRRVLHNCLDERTRMRLRFVRRTRNPFFFMDFDDELGKVGRALGYFAQRGQDYFLDRYVFCGRDNGVFVDVGANDPVHLSNTYHFENRGWTGLAFEPQPRLRQRWAGVRRTPCLPDVLGDSDGTEVDFLIVATEDWQNALSGIQGVVQTAVPALRGHRFDTVRLHQRRLDSVLAEHGISRIDFLSIDVEGYEMNVLRGIDLARVDVDVIVIENDRTPLGDDQPRAYLAARGYRHIARLSGDDVFRKVRRRIW